MIIKNNGQNIWNELNVNLISDNKNIKVDNIRIKDDIYPFNTGLVAYSIAFPENPNIYEVNIGFYVNQKSLGSAYSGKIISFPLPQKKNNKFFDTINMFYLSIKNVLKGP